MLPLNLPGLADVRTEEDGPLFAIHAGCEGKPDACPSCGSESLYAHGTHQQDINDLPHQGRVTCIHQALEMPVLRDYIFPSAGLDLNAHENEPFFAQKKDPPVGARQLRAAA